MQKFIFEQQQIHLPLEPNDTYTSPFKSTSQVSTILKQNNTLLFPSIQARKQRTFMFSETYEFKQNSNLSSNTIYSQCLLHSTTITKQKLKLQHSSSTFFKNYTFLKL